MKLNQILFEANAWAFIACAGAGPELIRRLWETPGSSRYTAAAALLQAQGELERFIGFQPDSYCSREVAVDMAIAAYVRAARTLPADAIPKEPLAIAVTAAVATDRIPRGDQRAHIAVLGRRGMLVSTLQLQKDTGPEARMLHDRQVADEIERLLEEALADGPPLFEPIAYDRIKAHPIFLPDGRRKPGFPKKGAYFPANFNPPHEGHELACREAEKAIGQKVHYMIEVCPPHKPAIPITDLLKRLALLQPCHPAAQTRDRAVALTIAEPTYLDKARARPGSCFIAGADAIARMLQPNWGYDVGYMLEEMDYWIPASTSWGDAFKTGS